MNSCELLFSILVEGLLEFESGGLQLLGKPLWGVSKSTERFDRGCFSVIGRYHPDFTLSLMNLDDAFDETVGSLA